MPGMDIRQTEFWQEIESIFPPYSDESIQSQDYPLTGRICRYHQFIDRLENSAGRARRNKRYALLIMLQFSSIKHSDDESFAALQLELLLCRISSCLRSSDSLCDLGRARFAVLLEDLKEPSAVPMVIEKLAATLSAPSRGADPADWLPPSFGATMFPVDGIPVSQIWFETETALERALAKGTGACSISPVVTGQAAMEQFELSNDLYRAYRNNEFEICYQPIIDMAGNRMCAIEGLLRWRHPERGSLCPATFLPMLEETGLIVPVGERLIKRACLAARDLMNEGRGSLRVCINVSVRQLTDSGFLLSVFDALYESNLEPSSLQLELPEPALKHERDALHRVLSELKNSGVHLAVDHFGTGDAGLVDLVRLPVSLIKLDHTLVERLVEDPVSKAIVSGTFALAKSAGMTVAAVGVEKQAQASELMSMGCSEAQGKYYFSPLPASGISATLG